MHPGCGARNDFIPGLPSLDVKDGALDFMLRTYTENVHEMGYLTDKGTLNLPALEQFVGHVAESARACSSYSS